ncbi:MAG TPA: AAA domain-containing protein, partial [Candidatus Syntrophosphaera sp.]|nr:AAA domain-containing protein [Candidatus Syntrophosphaera sp.]
MAKPINKRYELIPGSGIVAQDLLTDDIVRLHTLECQKLPELVHNAFLRRAKELSQLKHPGLTRLLDFGFDTVNHCYFLVFEQVSGKPLEKVLPKSSWPQEWVLHALIEVADALAFLHMHNMYMGYLQLSDIVLNMQEELPLRIADPALESFEILVGLSESEGRDLLQEDIFQFGLLAAILLTRNPDPNQSQIQALYPYIPQSFQGFLQRACFQDPQPYSSINETRRDLLKALTEVQTKTTYYLIPTHTAAQALYDLGFTPKAEIYQAADFLTHELQQERHGRISDRSMKADQGNNGSKTYYVTGASLRLVCAPGKDAPDKYLAILNVETPSGTGLVTEREVGMPIQATLCVTTQGKVPKTTNILALLDGFVEHYHRSEQTKKRELARKSSIETWTKVLDLQRRLINQFQLLYTDWELTDGDTAIWVTLKNKVDALDVSMDERLMMSAADGKGAGIIVGYWEELDGNRLKISLTSQVNPEEIAKQGNITLDNTQARSILNRQENGLRRLRYGESVNPDLLALLSDPTALTSPEEYITNYWDPGLDDVQQQAASRALAAKDMFLIHGPPGTGKTRTIVEIARQALNDDKADAKILITSQSNVAVNHALTTLLEMQPGLRDAVVRVGREEKAGQTTDLLINQQMQRWLGQVKERSSAYLEKERKKFAFPQLAECLGVLDECEKIETEIAKDQADLQKQEMALQNVSQDLKAMQDILARTENLRNSSASLLQKISEKDALMRQLLQAFDTGYLGWAEKFLEHARNAANLSGRRVELSDRIQDLQQRVSSQQENLQAGVGLVSDALSSLFKVQLTDLKSQRRYVDEKLTSQRETALRLGRLQKVSQDWCQRISHGTEEFTGAYLGRCKVVGATCIGVAAKGEISEAEFDWVIVDEAGRSTHPELIVPMVRGRRIVLVGDHQQLPPIIDRNLEPEMLEEIGVDRSDLDTSLFQELIEPTQAKIRLQVQYRMHPAIGELISQSFYEGQLRHAENTEAIHHSLDCFATPVVWLDTSKLTNHQEHLVGTSYENLAEAQMAVRLLDRIERELSHKGLMKTVGVIAGYMAQKQLLRQQIRDLQRWPHLVLEVDTVDAYQGREMDYIIYSVVRSNPQRKIGFLQDERRLNVALSRAHELLVIIGDRDTAEMARTGRGDN